MTTFSNHPLDIIGTSYKSRSESISIQTTKNLYPEAYPTGKVIKALLPWPGSAVFADSVAAKGRGLHVFNDELYQVAGTTLYKITSSGARTTIGTVNGTSRVVFTDDGTNMILTTGSTGYYYDGTLSQITDPDYNPANSCAYLNTQVIYDADGGSFQVSDPGQPVSINALNFATAESSPDDTIRVFVKNQLIYIFGYRSLEIWYNSGTGYPPLDRIQNGVMSTGLISPYAVTDTTKTVYFMGHDKNAYRLVGYKEDPITPPGLAVIFADFNMSDCHAHRYKTDANEFVIFKFPTEGRTFVFSENTNYWFELTTGAEEKNYFAGSFATVYGMDYVENESNGAVHVLSHSLYKNISETIIRERISSPFSGDLVGLPGQRLLMDRIRFVVEKGVGIPSGQGSDPMMMVSLSFDSSSFTNEVFLPLGRTGEKLFPVDMNYSFEFYEVVVRVRFSDPTFFSLHNASIDVAPVSGY